MYNKRIGTWKDVANEAPALIRPEAFWIEKSRNSFVHVQLDFLGNAYDKYLLCKKALKHANCNFTTKWK